MSDEIDEAERKAEARAREEIKRLLAQGSEITLADGSSLTLVYTAPMLMKIEADYGSLDAYFGQIGGRGGKVLHLIAYTLHLALRAPVEKVAELIDTRQIVRYQEAMMAAYAEAMPIAEEGEEGNAVGPSEAPFPGLVSSMSSSPTSTSRPRTSGA